MNGHFPLAGKGEQKVRVAGGIGFGDMRIQHESAHESGFLFMGIVGVGGDEEFPMAPTLAVAGACRTNAGVVGSQTYAAAEAGVGF